MPTAPEIFLAHAAADTAAAEQLFDLLCSDVRVWLDTRALQPTDAWAVEIARAQREALLTVIPVSRNTDHAFYVRDEIQSAITSQQASSGERRVVAVFLDGRPQDRMQVPYGLRDLHSIDAVTAGGLDAVAAQLRALLPALRARGAPAPLPASSASIPTAAALYEKLRRLTLGGQIDTVILYADLPRADIAPAGANVNQRALDIVQIAQAGGDAMALKVAAAIKRAAPWLPDVEPQPPLPPQPALTPKPPPQQPTSPEPAAPARARVLLIFANPIGTAALRLGTEERALRESIRLAGEGRRLEVEALHAATIDDLRRALIASPRTIVHFSGHGGTDGLRFEDGEGKILVPDPAALASILRRRKVETVVLNACYSLSIVEGNPMGTRYTVAMEGAVNNAGALEFARGFYDVMAATGDVEDAYLEGLDAAAAKNLPVKATLVRG